jgi:hypothetical protein
MVVDASNISLGPKAWPSSLNHFQGPVVHTYYSKTPSGIHIHNNRPIIPSRGHVCFFKEYFLALYV